MFYAFFDQGLDDLSRQFIIGRGHKFARTLVDDVMGKNFPAMAVIGTTGLVEPEALLEIETTAVVEN
jgi:enamine deaminase RidA (YjgF/YER057c/UK114 family)